MKKMFLAMVLALMLVAVPAFAGDNHNYYGGSAQQGQQQGQIQGQQQGQAIIGSGNSTNVIGSGIGNFSPSATIGNVSTGSITDNSKTYNTNTNMNVNSNDSSAIGVKGDVKQGQIAINEGNTTDIDIKTPQALLGLPSQSVPELNFGNGKMTDATGALPAFAIYGIKPLKGEMIKEVLSVNANVKFKNLYKSVLEDAAGVANGGKKTLADVRYQIIRAEAQKSWHTGGNMGGGGSGLASSGLGGGSGAGSLIPSWGGTKADDLFTVIFVKVAL